MEDEREDRQLSHEDLRCQYLLHESVWYLVKSGGPKRTRVVVASRGGKKYSYGQECWLDTATLLEQLRRQRTSSDAPHYDDLEEEAGEGGDCFCGNTDEPAEGTKWIECDECLKWCHLSCTELGKSQPGDKDRSRYVCPRCSDADDLEGGADGSRKKRARKTSKTLKNNVSGAVLAKFPQYNVEKWSICLPVEVCKLNSVFQIDP